MIRVFLFVLIFITSSFSHKLSVFTNIETNQLYVSTYFGNGKPCKSCKIKFISMDNKLIKEIKVDNKGEVFYPIKEDKLLLRVDAGSGHVQTQIVINEKVKLNKQNNKSENLEYEKLKKENLLLKAQVKSLEEKLDLLEVFKVLFGLLIIFVIFYILKKVKK